MARARKQRDLTVPAGIFENLGRLGRGEPHHVAQHGDRAEVGRQRLERLHDRAALARGLVVVAPGGRLGDVVEGRLRPAAADEVVALVDGDAIEPGGQLRAARKRGSAR